MPVDLPPNPALELPENPVAAAIAQARAGRMVEAMRLFEVLHADRPGNNRIKAWLGHCLVVTGLDRRHGLRLLRETVGKRKLKIPLPRQTFITALLQRNPARALKAHAELATDFPALREQFISAAEDTKRGRAYKALLGAMAGETRDMVLFFHLPFTGGTSLHQALSACFPPRQIFNIPRRKGLRKIARYARLPDMRLKRVRYLHLHHPFPLDLRERTAHRFTILRDPVACFLSGAYKRWQPGGKILPDKSIATAQSGDLAAAVSHVIDNRLTNPMTRQLAALHPQFIRAYAARYPDKGSMVPIGHEDDLYLWELLADHGEDQLEDWANQMLVNFFDPPGVTEHLQVSYMAQMARLGLPLIPALPHSGASNRPDTLSAEDQQALDRLQQASELDRNLHQRWASRFADAHASLIETL